MTDTFIFCAKNLKYYLEILFAAAVGKKIDSSKIKNLCRLPGSQVLPKLPLVHTQLCETYIYLKVLLKFDG